MTISLGRRLPDASSSRPGSWMRNEPLRAALERANFFLLGLAPNGVYRARPVTRPAGELLPHRFTLTDREKPCRRFAFCGTFPSLAAGGSYPPLRSAEPGLSSR